MEQFPTLRHRSIRSAGFTIVELLIVIVVIAILAAISIVAYNGIQSRAKDAARVQKVTDIAKALEMYKVDKGEYPRILDGASQEGSCGSQTDNWGHCDRLKMLTDMLAPYASVDLLSLSDAIEGAGTFYYTSQASDNYQTYGMYIKMIGSGDQGDGGYFANYYEVGPQPRYCMSKYTGTNASWKSYNNVCVGGD